MILWAKNWELDRVTCIPDGRGVGVLDWLCQQSCRMTYSVRRLFWCAYHHGGISISFWKTGGKFHMFGLLLGCCTLQLVYHTHPQPQNMQLPLLPWHNTLIMMSWFWWPFWPTHANIQKVVIHWPMHSDWCGLVEKRLPKTISTHNGTRLTGILSLSCRINTTYLINKTCCYVARLYCVIKIYGQAPPQFLRLQLSYCSHGAVHHG